LAAGGSVDASLEEEDDSTFELPLGMGMWGLSVSMATAFDLSRGISSTWGHMMGKYVCVFISGLCCVFFERSMLE
jgi:hypothetical protein